VCSAKSTKAAISTNSMAVMKAKAGSTEPIQLLF
jgi:hypothetical protein